MSKSPDLVLVRGAEKGEDGAMTQELVRQNEIHPAYLKVSVNYSTGALDVLREYRIYDDVRLCDCQLQVGTTLKLKLLTQIII